MLSRKLGTKEAILNSFMYMNFKSGKIIKIELSFELRAKAGASGIFEVLHSLTSVDLALETCVKTPCENCTGHSKV